MTDAHHATGRAALAAVTGCLGAVVAYALIRVAQRLLSSEPDPALVFYSVHSGFFWRAWIALYVGGTCAFLGWLAAARDAARTARLLGHAVFLVLAVVALQAALLP